MNTHGSQIAPSVHYWIDIQMVYQNLVSDFQDQKKDQLLINLGGIFFGVSHQ